MDPTQRIADYLAAYRITDQNGIPVDSGLLASDIMNQLGKRKKVYACIKQDLDILCEHQHQEIEVIALEED